MLVNVKYMSQFEAENSGVIFRNFDREKKIVLKK